MLLEILSELGLGNVVILCQLKLKSTEIVESFNERDLLQDFFVCLIKL